MSGRIVHKHAGMHTMKRIPGTSSSSPLTVCGKWVVVSDLAGNTGRLPRNARWCRRCVQR